MRAIGLNQTQSSGVLDSAMAWLDSTAAGLSIDPYLFKYGAAAVAVLLLALAVRLALRLCRNRGCKVFGSDRQVLDELVEKSVLVDVLVGDPRWYALAARCIIVSAGKKGLTLEVIEEVAMEPLKPGTALVCAFKPIRIGQRKVDGFSTTLLEFTKSTGQLVRFMVANPESMALIKRRRHGRKRVMDQQFVRAKIWLADPADTDKDFNDAAPDLAVNTHDVRLEDQQENSIVNISKGGMAVSVRKDLVGRGWDQDAHVVLNIFMFNLREKIFKPYWYAGRIRSLEEVRNGFVRLGVEFTRVAAVDPEDGSLHWTSV